MWVMIVLFFVAVTLPIRIAFYETDSTLWQVINYTIDTTFASDIILTFFTIVPDLEDTGYITDRGKIAKMYLTSWFAIDIISIMPIDKMVSNATNKLT